MSDRRPRAQAFSYVADMDGAPGFSRMGTAGHFRYRTQAGRPVKAPAILARIRALAIPPAWTDVWIASSPSAHIQATGRDARGRKQYRYHDDFRATQERAKFDHMLDFVRRLPRVRARVRRDMAREGLSRDKVLATVVHLLETTLVRIGNADYAAQNASYGLTTLQARHAKVIGQKLRLAFTGKAGKAWRVDVHDPRVARIVKAVQNLPGRRLFQYLDENGKRHVVNAADVNAYLRDAAGMDVTAKDFRTWSGTMLAAVALSTREDFQTAAAAKRNIRAAIDSVASVMGNTPAVCRKSYVHPVILERYLTRDLVSSLHANARRAPKAVERGLRVRERAVLGVLSR